MADDPSEDVMRGLAAIPFPPEADRAKRRAADFEKRVVEAKELEGVRREARRRQDAEDRGPIPVPEIVTLRDWLAQPEAATRWRIEGLQPAESRIVLAAPMKAGKTTLVGSLVRSLTDGDVFLGRFPVCPVAGRVAILDLEMSRGQLRAWLRDQRIAHDDRVIVISLRGRAGSLNLLDPATRATWVTAMRQYDVKYLILDPLRPVLDALGLDEHREAGRFLVGFDALLHEAGIPDALIVHHMGHVAERSRGDSRLRDYPDVEWQMVRQGEDPASPRYFKAYGRDVQVPETLLNYHAATRGLTLATGSRKDATTRAALADVVAALGESKEPLSIRGIETACAGHGHPRSAIRAAINAGIRAAAIVAEAGPKRSILHRLPSQCASAPECTDSAPAHSSPASAPVRRRPSRSAHSHARKTQPKSRKRKDPDAAH